MTTATAEGPCAAFWNSLRGAVAPPAAVGQAAQAATTAPAEAAQQASNSGPQQQQSACCPPPNWMPIAVGEIGVAETSGSAANPRILEYFTASRFWGTDDSGGSNAWCASFVAWVMSQAGYDIATDAFRAKEWMNRWSGGTNIGRPLYGAIAVKSRSGGGHVGFVMGLVPGTTDQLAILGGNQGDATNVTAYPQSVFEAFMVPTDYAHSCCILTEYAGTIRGIVSET